MALLVTYYRYSRVQSGGASLRISQAVVPVLTVKRGQVFEPEWGPHPWGWEPKRIQKGS